MDTVVHRPPLDLRHSELDRVQSVQTVDRPPSSVSSHHAPKPWNPLSIHVLVLLMPASTLGTLARLGLRALASYDGHSIFPLAYAQGLGCLVMGFVLQLKEPFGHFYPPLYTAIATGFCGSLTTFSGWQLDVFNSWIDTDHYHRSAFRNFMDGLGLTVFTLSISIGSLSFGALLASTIHPFLPVLPRPRRTIRCILSAVSILTYAATFPLYFFMSAKYRHRVTAALLFAFPGTLTRYLLSIQFNPLVKEFPLGTLLANLLGTALLAAFIVLQSTTHPVSPSACSLLQGLSDGYCGCLTTVSTFSVELYAMTPRRGFQYGLLSWVGGQIFMVVVLGASIWSGHATKDTTCSYS